MGTHAWVLPPRWRKECRSRWLCGQALHHLLKAMTNPAKWMQMPSSAGFCPRRRNYCLHNRECSGSVAVLNTWFGEAVPIAVLNVWVV